MVWNRSLQRMIACVFALAFTFSACFGGMITAPTYAQDATAEIAGGGGAVWTAKQVNVLLFTGDYWTPIIERMVKDAQKALPPKGPRLNVKKQSPHSCEWVRNQHYSQPTITFCELDGVWYAGSTALRSSHHVIKNERAYVELVRFDDEAFNANTPCHEMMHALSWVNDNYNYNKDSCVQGERPTFGPWDIKFLQNAYQKHDTKADRKRHDRRENDHRGNGRRGGKHGGKHGGHK